MARRSRYEGTFIQTEKGLWQGRVRLRTASGELKRFSKYGKTKAEARAKIKELVKAQEAGVLSTRKAPTVAEYMLSWSQNADLKQSTRNARDLNRRRALPVIGGIQLDKLTPEHIRKLDNKLDADGLSGASRNQCFDVLKTAMGQAVRDGIIVSSPFTRITWVPPVAHKEMRFLTMREQAALYAVNDAWTPCWQFLLATGLRSGEGFALSWRQVDLDAGRISITQSIHWKPGGWDLASPKTPQSRRTLQISPEVVEILRAVKAKQDAERGRLGEYWDNPEEFVFTRGTGEPVLPHHAHHALQAALDKAGVRPCRVHDLRHSFAANHINNGTPILAVSRMLGHSTVGFTLQVYGHLSIETQEAAASLSGRLLSEAVRLAEAMEVVA